MSMKDEHKSADEIRQSLIDYRQYAMEKYKENPVMTSRMILVHLKLIAVLDRRVTLVYPLYKNHRCGINSNIITTLLLPQRPDMETALRLEQYFRLRNENARGPGLTEEKHVTDKSFSVQFAENDANMQKIRMDILKLDAVNIKRKEKEWIEGRQQVERLREKAKRLGCSFVWTHGDQVHDYRCQRCYCNRQADKVLHFFRFVLNCLLIHFISLARFEY